MVMGDVSKINLVLDCSLTMAWCFEDESSEYSEQVLDIVADRGAIVPALWCVEAANALTVAERRKRISHIKAVAFREYLNMLPIYVDDYLLRKPVEVILDLARETGLTAYDATYLELAIRQDLPLATLDKELKKVAEKTKIYFSRKR